MRGKAMLILAVGLAACSKQAGTGSQDAPHNIMAEMSDTGQVFADARSPARGPGIAVTAAPGVAFRYGYDFRVPAVRIAKTQEAHARACEALGITQCRIIGMHYEAGRDAEDIRATLDLKLDPAIARKFGSDGIDAAIKAGGQLSSADITGVDAGGAIRAIDKGSAQLHADLARIEEQLAKLPPSARERVVLQTQADALREDLRLNINDKDSQQAMLATTPMHFNYASMATFAGFDAQSVVGSALSLGSASFATALSLLAIVVAGGGPWALLAGIGYLFWRQFRRRFNPA